MLVRRLGCAAALAAVLLCEGALAGPSVQIADGTAVSAQSFALVDNRIFLEARINGRGPYQFIFDTGGQNILDHAVALDLGLALRDGAAQSGAGSGTQRSWRAEVSEAAIGGVRLTEQEFMVLSLEPIRRAIGFRRLDGLVGRELFERFVVDIDYETSTLRFVEPSEWKPAAENGPVLALDFVAGSVPVLAARIDGIAGTLAIDTGDRSSLTLFGPFASRHGLREKYRRKITAVTGWGVGGPIPADVARVRRLAIGGHEISDVVGRMPTLARGVFASSIASGSIGTGVLKRFRITFDYGRRQLFLAPNARFGSPDPHDRSGLWLSLADGGFEVMSVVAQSPAAAQGIVVGDVVTAVDGLSARDIFLVDLRERLKAAEPGTTVRLTLKSKRGARTAAIVLRDLI